MFEAKHYLQDCVVFGFRVEYEYWPVPEGNSVQENRHVYSLKELEDLLTLLHTTHGTKLIFVDVTVRIFPKQVRTRVARG